MRRQDGLVSFSKSWEDYKNGFGLINGDFWLGNEYVHSLTAQKKYDLRFDAWDVNDDHTYGLLTNFRIGSEDQKYQLGFDNYLGNFSSSFKEDMNDFQTIYFSTYDQDNNVNNNRNCATTYKGGWWFIAKTTSLTTKYKIKSCYYKFCLTCQFQWHIQSLNLKKTDMMIRIHV